MMDAGIVSIYNLKNVANDGDMPKNKLVLATDKDDEDMVYQFQEKVIGFSRQYEAIGVNQRVDMLIRIWRAPVHVGQFAVLTDYEDQENDAGDQYRIDNVQQTTDMYGLKVTDLTLYRLDDLYEIAAD